MDLNSKKQRKQRKPQKPHYEPTRKVIKAACERIQAGWAEGEFAKRRVENQIFWAPQIISDLYFQNIENIPDY